MVNARIISLLFVVIGTQTFLAAQPDAGNPSLTPNGVVLTRQTIVKEIVPNYDSLMLTIDTASLYHYETVYMPVQYDLAGEVTAYDYVTTTVKDAPYFPIKYVSSEVLMAVITLPKAESLDIGRLFFKLGENSTTGYNLLDATYQTTNSTSPYEVVNTEDFTVLIINLGSNFVNKPSYLGQVVIQQNSTGALTSPFVFSATINP